MRSAQDYAIKQNWADFGSLRQNEVKTDEQTQLHSTQFSLMVKY